MAEKVMKRCVIVCASPDADAAFVKRNILLSDYVIAADGGMKTLGGAGVVPDLFVGDFDSFGGDVPEGVEVIKLSTHKDDTDSMHCASVALERGFKEVVLLGASGGCDSHTFSNYAVLSFLSDNGVSACMLTGDERVSVLREGEYSFDNLKGKGFSVFPFGCESVVVSYKGDVEYPAERLRIPQNSSLGKSNVFNCDSVVLAVSEGRAIVFNSI